MTLFEAPELNTYDLNSQNVETVDSLLFSQKRELTEIVKNYRNAIRDNGVLVETENCFLQIDFDSRLCFVSGFKNTGISKLLEVQIRKSLLNQRLENIKNVEGFNRHFDAIDSIISKIALLDFDDVIIESGILNSIVFKLSFSDDNFLIVNVPLENFDVENTEVVFTLLENREIIVNSFNTLANVVEGMQSYLVE